MTEETPRRVEIPLRVTETTAGVISQVGERSAGDGRGLARTEGMKLALQDGTEATIGRFIPDGMERVKFGLFASSSHFEFDRCPICLTPDPTSKEHVPPEALGGSVATLTCAPCNNDSGSRFEADLQDWFEEAVRVRVAGDGMRGERPMPRMLIRQRAEDGKMVAIVDGAFRDPEVEALLERGDPRIVAVEPDIRRVKVAALKSAYLAACILLEEVPRTPLAEEVRQLLVSSLALPKSARLPAEPLIDAVRIDRSYGRANGKISYLVPMRGPGDPPVAAQDVGLSLAGVLMVDWPLEHELIRLDQLLG